MLFDNRFMSPREVYASVKRGNELAATIRNGTYKPEGKPNHKQTPIEPGDFRYDAAMRSMASRLGPNAAAETALELSGNPALTMKEARRWIIRLCNWL